MEEIVLIIPRRGASLHPIEIANLSETLLLLVPA